MKSSMFSYGEAGTVHRRRVTGVDAYGRETVAWVDEQVDGLGFEPGSSSEPRAGAQRRVNTKPTLILPDGLVIGSEDQITVRGVRYEVEGETGVWRNPFTGWSPGGEVTLQKVTG